ncbi:MAG TPA: aminoglycoside phosphotransferase family protein [Anaerolineaceae bacterium]|nr:aminoglycoside phosphotransferase family protein [Anaerolineaceae bacterium]
MKIQQLTQLVRQHFTEQGAIYDLQTDAVQVNYRLNWAGFANASFQLSDGRNSYHFKVSEAPRNKAQLKRWQRLHSTLEKEYHAPRLVDWVDLPGSDYSGLLLVDIPGKSPDLVSEPALFQEVLSTIDRLHGDQVLGVVLRGLDGPRSCLKSYLQAYHNRFLDDLRGLEGRLPDWFEARQLDWLKSEVRGLEQAARLSSAFQAPAVSPVHGDLSPSNIIRSEGGRWNILDWDELTIGDPAQDWSLLLDPLGQARAEFPVGFGWHELVQHADPGLERRMEFYARVLLFDRILDGLADVVEGRDTGEDLGNYESAKKASILQALEQYRARTDS